MPIELVVGPVANEEIREAAQAWLITCLGRGAPADWNSEVEQERIPVPDFGAIMGLRDHASRLEGLEGLQDALERSRFGHLPLYPWQLWLPVEFAKSRYPLIDVKIRPQALGSAVRLKAELEEMRRLSREKGIPPGDGVDAAMALMDDAADKALSRKTVLRGFAG